MAAVTLQEAGCHVTLLEAGDAVGGRIRTVFVDGVPLELGAEFIHGKPPELLSLLDDLGLTHYELEGENLSYDAEGLHQGESDADDSPFVLLEQMTAWSDEHPQQDMSFAEYCTQWNVALDLRQAATGYVEGFNAADAHRISVRSLAVQQRAEDEISGDEVGHVNGGYARLPGALVERFQRAGGTLHLQAHVNAVAWSTGEVKAHLAAGETVRAEAGVIALPLGVLQAGAVRFDPVPGNVLEDAQRMVMGRVCRVNLSFRTRWWTELNRPDKAQLEKLSFLLPHGQRSDMNFRVFWTGFPRLDPVLTAWSGGPAAEAFAGKDSHEIAHAACADLATIFGVPREQVLDQLVSHHSHDWSADPLFGGAYSWVSVGGVNASAAMSVPVEHTLFFAGEHTDTTGHWGTVHGALRSGLRAARQVLATV